MTDPNPDGKSSGKSLWVAILILLLVLVVGWFANPFGKIEQGEQAAAPEPMSTNWAEEPSGPAVDVTVPDTPMTNVPAEPAGAASPAASPTG